MEVSKETWETAKLRNKINLTFWVVYLAKKDGKALRQNDHIIIDYFLDHPTEVQNGIFRKDWEDIQKYIKRAVPINYLVVWEFFLSQKPKEQIINTRLMLLMEGWNNNGTPSRILL